MPVNNDAGDFCEVASSKNNFPIKKSLRFVFTAEIFQFVN
jgi:hypothetical protein